MPESLTDTLATPARNTGGAPLGNRNRIRSGLQSFVLGRYPPGCSYISKQGHVLRRQLRAAVATQDGSTNVWSEAVIASACQHECRRLLLLRWLRLADDQKTIRKATAKDGLSVATVETTGLSIMDKAALLDRIGKATDSRDACLKSLGLDKRPDSIDPWEALHRQPAQLPAPATNGHKPGPIDVPAHDAPESILGRPDVIQEESPDNASTSQTSEAVPA